ncbi:MAG TPA: hydroxymethylbilane synthase [Candidatus Acidoferrales bacterium]|nr:hydroxymethylbilane synthase [Candidatus Acidoferrales bacterium]
MHSHLQRPFGRRAVVVGDGDVAAREAKSLEAAGFDVLIVAPEAEPSLSQLLEPAGNVALVVAACADARSNARVLDRAFSAAIPALQPARAGDVARAARTLARMTEYAAAAVEDAELRASLARSFADLPLSKLASMNAVEAEHEVERIAAERRPAARVTTTKICASRASALAMTQARAVAARLAVRGIATSILTVTTPGDRDRRRAIEALGSVNVFVGELEAALRDGRADYAVHSCKDLPSALDADMTIAAISSRDDARDAFCSQRYADFFALPPGAVVGTSSPRRRALLGDLRPDLEYRIVRGNVDTRLRKLREGEFDAIVLAMAGLNRLRLRAAHTVPFDPAVVVPAVAQGALAVETRAGDAELASELRAAVNDAGAELCVRCERAALRALRAGCSAPIGIYARLEGGTLRADGAYATPSGTIRRARAERAAGDVAGAEALGEELAAALRPPENAP